MRFCSLGSGSNGNATLIEGGTGRCTRVLVDCGFSTRELSTRLARHGLGCADIDAIFLTHEHGDHVGCALTLAKRHAKPIWMSRGTWRALGSPVLGDLLRFARDGETFVIGELQLAPYTVPHDACEPLQLCLDDGNTRLGLLTDAGCSTPHLLQQLSACDALLVECNHDPELLAASAYPPSLKARIGGRLGHLDNGTAAAVLAALLHPRLQHVVAAHLSERNNRPELALAALSGACNGNGPPISVADQATGASWIDLR